MGICSYGDGIGALLRFPYIFGLISMVVCVLGPKKTEKFAGNYLIGKGRTPIFAVPKKGV
jgi:hypothetical protein